MNNKWGEVVLSFHLKDFKKCFFLYISVLWQQFESSDCVHLQTRMAAEHTDNSGCVNQTEEGSK